MGQEGRRSVDLRGAEKLVVYYLNERMSLLHTDIKIENIFWNDTIDSLTETMTLSPLLLQQFRLMKKSDSLGTATVYRIVEEDVIS